MARVPAWKSQAVDLRNRMGCAMDYKPWTRKQRHFQGLHMLPRPLEVVELAAIAHVGPPPQKQHGRMRQLLRDVFVDVSQNPVRQPWTNKSMISPCLTTSTVLYCFERDRVVLPLELMCWQGHKADIIVPATMSQSSLRDLAGQGICLPCLAMLIGAAAGCGAFQK
ncbi:unnamed protein product [Symbiodinium sp. CCMP2592]|nr:unnamed protein product [Symbiodinium sp. CCMP2592]